MDIFVRSQNKKWFGKMGEMYVAKDDNGEYAIVHSGGAILGYYESEERCLKVIDEFQNFLADRMYHKDIYDFDYIRPMQQDEYEKLQKNTELHIVDKYVEIRDIAVELLVFEMPKE